MFSSVIERLNDRRSGAGEAGADAGFTLIELMVVLLILAILLAIAIPTFLGVTGGANDRAAQSNLNTALTNAKAQATQNNQSYGLTTNATLTSAEPSIKWVSGVTAAQGPVSTYVSTDGDGIVLASYSKNKATCWLAVDNIVAISAANGSFVTLGSGAPAAGVPTNAGTFYGWTAGACNPSDPALAVTNWQGTSFPAGP